MANIRAGYRGVHTFGEFDKVNRVDVVVVIEIGLTRDSNRSNCSITQLVELIA